MKSMIVISALSIDKEKGFEMDKCAHISCVGSVIKSFFFRLNIVPGKLFFMWFCLIKKIKFNKDSFISSYM